MTHPHDDTAPVEHDPTGMRALLASLPEPGPMPDDLVARISAALAAEAGRGSGIEQFWGPSDRADAADPTGPTDTTDRTTTDAVARVVPLRRRPRLRHLGVAAAVVGVIGLGGYALGSMPGDLTASFGAGGAADSAAGDDSAAEAGAKALVAPLPGSGDVVVIMSGIDHDSQRLADTARQLDEGSVDPLTALGAESPSIGPIGTAVGARAGADSLGIEADAGILVDVGEGAGASAAVLVVHDSRGRSAWAVDRSCTTGNTGLIRGPVSLD